MNNKDKDDFIPALTPLSNAQFKDIENYPQPQTDSIDTNCQCDICQKKEEFFNPNPRFKTTRLCIMILQSLKTIHPTTECFSLKTDIMNFINKHWGLFRRIPRFANSNWKKSLLDALNHCPQIECGRDFGFDRGYYRLKPIVDDDKSIKTEKTPKPSRGLSTSPKISKSPKIPKSVKTPKQSLKNAKTKVSDNSTPVAALSSLNSYNSYGNNQMSSMSQLQQMKSMERLPHPRPVPHDIARFTQNVRSPYEHDYSPFDDHSRSMNGYPYHYGQMYHSQMNHPLQSNHINSMNENGQMQRQHSYGNEMKEEYQRRKMEVGNDKEKMALSTELYQCYQDLERQLCSGVNSFSKLFKVYLKNNDSRRVNLLNDIMITQQHHIGMAHSFMIDWSTF